MNCHDSDFSSFFRTATGLEPYPYQVKPACDPIQSRLIHDLTGCGKTAALAFLHVWNRASIPKSLRLMAAPCGLALRRGGDR